MKKILFIFSVLVLLTGGSLLADEVTLDFINPGISNVGVNHLLINGQEVLGYCVDPGTSYLDQLYNNYTLIPIPITGPTQAPNGYLTAVAIFQIYGTDFSGYIDPDLQAAIVQNAIWAGLGMTYSSYGTAVQDILDEVANLNPNTDGYMLAVSPNTDNFFNVNNQDFIIRTPEPASLLLLGLGLFGVGLVRRKS